MNSFVPPPFSEIADLLPNAVKNNAIALVGEAQTTLDSISKPYSTLSPDGLQFDKTMPKFEYFDSPTKESPKKDRKRTRKKSRCRDRVSRSRDRQRRRRRSPSRERQRSRSRERRRRRSPPPRRTESSRGGRNAKSPRPKRPFPNNRKFPPNKKRKKQSTRVFRARSGHPLNISPEEAKALVAGRAPSKSSFPPLPVAKDPPKRASSRFDQAKPFVLDSATPNRANMFMNPARMRKTGQLQPQKGKKMTKKEKKQALKNMPAPVFAGPNATSQSKGGAFPPLPELKRKAPSVVPTRKDAKPFTLDTNANNPANRFFNPARQIRSQQPSSTRQARVPAPSTRSRKNEQKKKDDAATEQHSDADGGLKTKPICPLCKIPVAKAQMSEHVAQETHLANMKIHQKEYSIAKLKMRMLQTVEDALQSFDAMGADFADVGDDYHHEDDSEGKASPSVGKEAIMKWIKEQHEKQKPPKVQDVMDNFNVDKQKARECIWSYK